MAELSWLDGLHPLARALFLAVSGMGGLGIVGVILDKLFPSAKERMEDARNRRVEDDERILHLEAELRAANERYYAEREAHIATKERMVATDARLEMLATRIGLQKPITPEDIAEDRELRPPGEPHDDRREA